MGEMQAEGNIGKEPRKMCTRGKREENHRYGNGLHTYIHARKTREGSKRRDTKREKNGREERERENERNFKWGGGHTYITYNIAAAGEWCGVV